MSAWSAEVTPETAGWGYAGLRVAELAAGGSVAFSLDADEAVLVPLEGACAVTADGARAELAGRPSVFAGPTDVAYLPAGSRMAYQRVYGTPERPADVLAEVRTGDVVLIPHGWHGPSMAAPGYDLYYLNVMAGPAAERAWLIRDDPAHAWVRGTWAGQSVDPRLPIGRQ